MKTNMMMIGLGAALLASQSMPAQAINKEWSAVAGFVGGVLAANAVHCNRGYQRPVYYQQPVQQQVIYQPVVQPVCYQPVQPVVVYQQPVPSGHYEYRTERRFVPGYWVYEDMGCGNQRKVWQPGYFTNVRTKVWVETSVCENEW